MERGKNMEINDGHYHEALHTAYVLLDTWEKHVMEAPATQDDEELKAQAEKAHQTMFDFYQMAGAALQRRESDLKN